MFFIEPAQSSLLPVFFIEPAQSSLLQFLQELQPLPARMAVRLVNEKAYRLSFCEDPFLCHDSNDSVDTCRHGHLATSTVAHVQFYIRVSLVLPALNRSTVTSVCPKPVISEIHFTCYATVRPPFCYGYGVNRNSNNRKVQLSRDESHMYTLWVIHTGSVVWGAVSAKSMTRDLGDRIIGA